MPLGESQTESQWAAPFYFIPFPFSPFRGTTQHTTQHTQPYIQCILHLLYNKKNKKEKNKIHIENLNEASVAMCRSQHELLLLLFLLHAHNPCSWLSAWENERVCWWESALSLLSFHWQPLCRQSAFLFCLCIAWLLPVSERQRKKREPKESARR